MARDRSRTPEQASNDRASIALIECACDLNMGTCFSRADDVQPCPIGADGLCCRNCSMGPCRLVGKTDRGVCGATIDTVVARNLARMVAAGASAHSDHGRDLAYTLLEAAEGHAPDYGVRDPYKLIEMARYLDVETKDAEGEDKPMVAQISALLAQSQDESKALPLFFLIPRHPQRFDEAARLLDAAGCRYARWSVLRDDPKSQQCLASIDVVLGDTMGEMPFFYAAADVAVVGGSFERHGGQNFIEACAIGTPVVVGPHTYNFADAVASALQVDAIVQVPTPQGAFEQVQKWLRSPEQAAKTGLAGRAWVTNHLGATERMMQAISELDVGNQQVNGLEDDQH